MKDQTPTFYTNLIIQPYYLGHEVVIKKMTYKYK